MKFVAEADSLSIEFEDMERLFAFKRRLVLARKDIADISWAAKFINRDRKLRVGGIGFPWLLAGRFRDIDAKESLFLYIRRPKIFSLTGGFSGDNVLIVTMREGSYKQIIVNCESAIGQQLVGWWRGEG